MTGKRFTIIDGVKKGTHSGIWDNQKQHNQGTGDELWIGEVVGMLNEGVDIVKELDELNDENRELKEIIEELRTIDKEKDIEVEHINNIYKEFGFKGLMDYAKDKLQVYGVVREVGGGLWLLATGGWSDNEFWLDCLLHWDFMYVKGYYRATTSGGGYYYSEKPYDKIKVILEDLE